jgi:oxygen-dependent protoporphyrinogen oxidase
MLGNPDPNKKDITIIGAGIAGLLLANRMDELGYEVTLLESAERAGGMIRTAQTPFGIAESAAHSLLASPAVRAQFDELKVPLVEVGTRTRYVFRRGKLRKFPLSPLETLVAIFRAYFVLADRSYSPDEVTLERWSRRHLGRGGLDYLLTPFVRGIYGAEPGEVLVGAAFPALKIQWGHSLLSQTLSTLRRDWGKTRDKKPMVAPALGMESLVEALERRLAERLGERFKLGTPVDRLPLAGNLALCTPAAEAARLIEREDPKLAELLSKVRYAPLISATVFVAAERVPPDVTGVGVLVPKVEGHEALGILFNSSSFPQRVAMAGTASFTMMLGGTSRPELLELDEPALRALVETEMASILGIRGGIKDIVIHRQERAVPIYDADLVDTWDIARRTWCSRAGQMLFGNYTGQVSLRGMIESVRGIA